MGLGWPIAIWTSDTGCYIFDIINDRVTKAALFYKKQVACEVEVGK